VKSAWLEYTAVLTILLHSRQIVLRHWITTPRQDVPIDEACWYLQGEVEQECLEKLKVILSNIQKDIDKSKVKAQALLDKIEKNKRDRFEKCMRLKVGKQIADSLDQKAKSNQEPTNAEKLAVLEANVFCKKALE
jgi:hypothetical protein